MSVIRSVFTNQDNLLRAILNLHCPDGIDCDPTYGKGNFYKEILKPSLKFDISPQVKRVRKADAVKLPLKKRSLSSIMFDPPFLATTGPSLKKEDRNNIITKQFGWYPTEEDLHRFYVNALKEFYRVLKKGGKLIFKCQDKVSSGKQYFSHCFVMYEAFRVGFYPLDLFVLVRKSRVVADWQVKNQQHARKFHCYFWVFEKRKPKVNYLKLGEA